MLPILTPDEMAAVDRAAPEPVEVLIGRAGAAVARHAVDLLGGTYGRRVVVVAGKGNNGNDGREAARRLAGRGVRVAVVPAADAPDRLDACDLVIDAAYGTGFRGSYRPPEPGGAPVLAVDIPSGVAGATGEVADSSPLAALRTVTFAALKPGLLFHPGRALAGEVAIADIGLDVSGAGGAGVVTGADVAGWLPRRPPQAHKWRAAVVLAAGSAGMTGAADLASAAAQRAGAGMVRVASPGLEDHPGLPTEAIAIGVPAAGWDTEVLSQLERATALVVGPGLGLSAPTVTGVRHVIAGSGVPAVVDGDGLTALGADAAEVIGQRREASPVVLTPHDGEFARLAGEPPGTDRCGAARRLAAATGAVVVLKGPGTVVAEPGGRVAVSLAGDQRLATAGTGDVLSGVIGALLAQGVGAFEAAAAGAWVHGTAATVGPPTGLVASDLVGAVPAALALGLAGRDPAVGRASGDVLLVAAGATGGGP